MKYALVFVVPQPLIVLALLEQVLYHLHVVSQYRIEQRQVAIVVFDVGPRLYSFHDLHVLACQAHNMLDCLSLKVLLASCLEKVYLTRGIIEPIKDRWVVGSDRVEKGILAFYVFDQ